MADKSSRAVAAASLASWMIVSSSLIILNKQLMVDHGFNFPLALTAAGQTASCLLGLFMAWLRLAKLQSPPSLQFMTSQLLPVALFSAGTLYYGNAAYLHLPVAFIQIMKVATPLFTLCISAIVGLESLSVLKCISMLFILVGSGLAIFVESSTAGFSWHGFSLMLFSALLESIKVVYIQKLLRHSNYASVELMVYLGPPTAVILASASWLKERNGLLEYGLVCIQQHPCVFLLAIALGFAVNLSTAYSIKSTSGLTFKVWGCMKNTAVVVIGCVMGDQINLLQAVGYAISTTGFVLYSWVKMSYQEGAPEQKKLM